MRKEEIHWTMSKLARGLVHDREFAQELVQETWLRSLQHSVEVGPGFIEWARATMRHMVIDRWRSDSARTWHEQTIAQERLRSHRVTSNSDPRVGMVTECLERLPEEQRSVLEMRYVQGLSIAEIAGRTGEGVEAIRSRHRRAIVASREMLDAEHGNDRRQWAVLFFPMLANAKKMRNGALAGVALVAVAVTGVLVYRATSKLSDSQLVDLDSRAADVARIDEMDASRSVLRVPVDQAAEIDQAPQARAKTAFRLRALGSSGEPTADAEVFVAHTSKFNDRVRLGVTNAAGEFVFEHERPGFWVCVEKEGYCASHSLALDLPPIRGAEETLLTAYLYPGEIRVAGVVSDESGAGVQGAEVNLRYARAASYHRRIDGHVIRHMMGKAVSTDGDGRFDLGYLSRNEANSYYLFVRHPGRLDLAPSVHSIEGGNPRGALNLALLPGVDLRIKLRVVDGSAPLDAESCRIEYAHGSYHHAPEEVAPGQYTFRGVGPTASVFHVLFEGGAKHSLAVTSEWFLGEEIALGIPPPQTVNLKVVDLDGRPLVGWRAVFTRAFSSTLDPVARRSEPRPNAVMATTDSEGALRALLTEGGELKALLFPPKGPLDVAAAVLKVAQKPVVNATITVDPETPEPCTLVGRVVPVGQVLPEWIVIDVGASQILGGKSLDVDPTDGRFELQGLPPGPVTMRILGQADRAQVISGITLERGQVTDLGNIDYVVGRPLVLNLRRVDGTKLVDPYVAIEWLGKDPSSHASGPSDGVFVGDDGRAVLPPILRPLDLIELFDENGAYGKLLRVTEADLRKGEIDAVLEKTVTISFGLGLPASVPGPVNASAEIVSAAGETLALKSFRFDKHGRIKLMAALPLGAHRVEVETLQGVELEGTMVVATDAAAELTVELELAK